MKKLIIGGILTTSLLLIGHAQAKYIDPVTERHLVKICEAIKSDSKIKLHIAVRDSGISIKNIGKGLVCNGYDPVTFAIINKAEKNAKFMAHKTNVNYEELLAKL